MQSPESRRQLTTGPAAPLQSRHPQNFACTAAAGNPALSRPGSSRLGRPHQDRLPVRKARTHSSHFPGGGGGLLGLGEASETTGGHTLVTESAYGNPFERPLGPRQTEKTYTEATLANDSWLHTGLRCAGPGRSNTLGLQKLQGGPSRLLLRGWDTRASV